MHCKVDFTKCTLAQDPANSIEFASSWRCLIKLPKMHPNHLHQFLDISIEHQLFFVTAGVFGQILNLRHDWTFEWFLAFGKRRQLDFGDFSDMAKHRFLFLTFRKNLVADHGALWSLLVIRFVIFILINRLFYLLSIALLGSTLVWLTNHVKDLDDWNFINVKGMIICILWSIPRCLSTQLLAVAKLVFLSCNLCDYARLLQGALFKKLFILLDHDYLVLSSWLWLG